MKEYFVNLSTFKISRSSVLPFVLLTFPIRKPFGPSFSDVITSLLPLNTFYAPSLAVYMDK